MWWLAPIRFSSGHQKLGLDTSGKKGGRGSLADGPLFRAFSQGLKGKAARAIKPSISKIKRSKKKNIQQQGFACGHPPYY
jgi:hypothetical protein